MKCPFRKITKTIKYIGSENKQIEKTTEEFSDCLEGDCMAHFTYLGYPKCKLLGDKDE